jgi:two-component system, sensor histidine kinase and response regulator
LSGILGGREGVRQSPPAQSPLPTLAVGGSSGRWCCGIRARLLIALVAVAAIVLVGGGLAWWERGQAGSRLFESERAAMSQLRGARALSEATARLAAPGGGFAAAATGERRQATRLVLDAQIGTIQALIDQGTPLGLSAESLAGLRAVLAAYAEGVATRDSLAERSLAVEAELDAAMAGIGRLAEDWSKRAGPVEGPDLADFHAALDLARSVGHAATLNQVAAARREFGALMARLQSRHGGRAGQGADGPLSQLRALGEGPSGVFDLRRRALTLKAELRAEDDKGQDLAARLWDQAHGLAVATEAAALQAEAVRSAQWQQGAWPPMAAFAVLIGLVGAWVYLDRTLAAPVVFLAAAVRGIVASADTPERRLRVGISERRLHVGISERRLRVGISERRLRAGGGRELAAIAADFEAFQDVMMRMRAEGEAFRESERRLRTILDTAPLALAAVRVADHRLMDANPRWRTLFMTGEDGDDAVSRQNFAHIVGLVFEHGIVEGDEGRMRRADGGEFWAMLSAAPLTLDGRAAIVVSACDITKRKEQDAALAEAAKRGQTLFLSAMSHEIRAPLNGLLTLVRRLEDMDLASEPRKLARGIRESSVSLLSIVNDIHDFSRIEAGQLTLEREEISLLDMVEGVADLLAPRAAEKGVGFLTEVDPNLPDRLLADPVRLRQLVATLAAHAVAVAEQGHVLVSVTTPDAGQRPVTLRIEVIDTGGGLDEETSARLFAPGAQADTPIAYSQGGPGLSLSLCGRLVAMMAGRIGCARIQGEGSTVWVEVPLTVVSAAPEAAPDLEGVAVLLLAGDVLEGDILRRSLGHAGAHVTVAASMEGVVAAARTAAEAGWGYDAVLLDGGRDPADLDALAGALPGAGGKTAPKAIAMLPATAVAADMAIPPPAGLFAILPKPVHRRLLWRIVAAAAGRGSPGQAWPPATDEPIPPALSPVVAPAGSESGGEPEAVLDLTPMREIFGAVTEEARSMLVLFLDTTRPLVDETRRAIEAGDARTAREAIHAAKGAGGSAGARRFARLCADCEAACARGDLDTARRLLAPTEQAFAEVGAAIAVLLH